MKVYKFYICKKSFRPQKYPAINSDNVFETPNGKMACLYGFTDNKVIRDEFIEYRNMNIFKMQTVSMSKDEYELFANSNADNELEYNSFGTATIENESIKIRPVQLVTTNKEASMVFIDYDLIAEGSLFDIFEDISRYRDCSAIFDNIINFPNIFKHDIIEALKYLEFINVMLDYFAPDRQELPFKTFEEDKLMAYIKLFGNTYKQEML